MDSHANLQERFCLFAFSSWVGSWLETLHCFHDFEKHWVHEKVDAEAKSEVVGIA